MRKDNVPLFFMLVMLHFDEVTHATHEVGHGTVLLQQLVRMDRRLLQRVRGLGRHHPKCMLDMLGFISSCDCDFGGFCEG